MRDSSEPNTVAGCVDDAALAQEFVELLGRLNIRHHPMVADLKKANPTPAQVLYVNDTLHVNYKYYLEFAIMVPFHYEQGELGFKLRIISYGAKSFGALTCPHARVHHAHRLARPCSTL